MSGFEITAGPTGRRAMARSAFLALVLLGTALVPGCGNNSPTLPEVARAILSITVDPNPVPASQSPLTGTVSAAYRVTIQEVNGLGGEIVFVSSTVFDPETGQQVAINYFDGADLIVFVGSKRVEALGELVVPQTTSYVLPDFRVAANLTVSVQMKDDRDNLINLSQLVKIDVIE